MSDETRWLPSSDPEPAVTTLVEDKGGTWWVRVYDDEEGLAANLESDVETWTKVAGNYGPVRVVTEPPEPRRPHLQPSPPPWQQR